MTETPRCEVVLRRSEENSRLNKGESEICKNMG